MTRTVQSLTGILRTHERVSPLPWHGMKAALVAGFDSPLICSGIKATHVPGATQNYSERVSEGFSTCLRQLGRLCGAGRDAEAQHWLGRGVGCQKDKLLFNQAFNLQSSLTRSEIPLFQSSEIWSVLVNTRPSPLQIHSM